MKEAVRFDNRKHLSWRGRRKHSTLSVRLFFENVPSSNLLGFMDTCRVCDKEILRKGQSRPRICLECEKKKAKPIKDCCKDCLEPIIRSNVRKARICLKCKKQRERSRQECSFIGSSNPMLSTFMDSRGKKVPSEALQRFRYQATYAHFLQDPLHYAALVNPELSELRASVKGDARKVKPLRSGFAKIDCEQFNTPEEIVLHFAKMFSSISSQPCVFGEDLKEPCKEAKSSNKPEILVPRVNPLELKLDLPQSLVTKTSGSFRVVPGDHRSSEDTPHGSFKGSFQEEGLTSSLFVENLACGEPHVFPLIKEEPPDSETKLAPDQGLQSEMNPVKSPGLIEQRQNHSNSVNSRVCSIKRERPFIPESRASKAARISQASANTLTQIDTRSNVSVDKQGQDQSVPYQPKIVALEQACSRMDPKKLRWTGKRDQERGSPVFEAENSQACSSPCDNNSSQGQPSQPTVGESVPFTNTFFVPQLVPCCVPKKLSTRSKQIRDNPPFIAKPSRSSRNARAALLSPHDFLQRLKKCSKAQGRSHRAKKPRNKLTSRSLQICESLKPR